MFLYMILRPEGCIKGAIALSLNIFVVVIIISFFIQEFVVMVISGILLVLCWAYALYNYKRIPVSCACSSYEYYMYQFRQVLCGYLWDHFYFSCTFELLITLVYCSKLLGGNRSHNVQPEVGSSRICLAASCNWSHDCFASIMYMGNR